MYGCIQNALALFTYPKWRRPVGVQQYWKQMNIPALSIQFTHLYICGVFRYYIAIISIIRFPSRCDTIMSISSNRHQQQFD